MAVGTARMFGIRLPENFHSPLKATSILDFWRRWHITLTRLTTRYVFNPTSLFFTRLTADLKLPKYLIIVVSAGPASFLTFVLIGLWHGLSWPFLLFGVIHSVMSLVEYLYFPKMEYLKKSDHYSLLKTSISRIVTLLLVMFSLILFRSYDISSFVNLIEAMFNYKSSMKSSFLSNNLMNSVILLIAFIISQSQPNTTEIFKRYRSVISTYHGYRKQPSSFSWRINWLLIFCIATVLGLSVMYRLRGSAAFIYADF
jgi:D-alanyl-lipoteichoic acid acyltransferase DltB (MBOAT superfamily)